MTSAAAADRSLAGARPLPLVLDVVVLSFEEVYERHLEFVWRCLRRMGIAGSALDDAVQDVFVVVHRRLAEFEGRSSIKTWLFGIAYRVARDHRRATARRGTPDALPPNLVAAEDLPDEALERKRSLALLDAILATLDDDKRAILMMVEVEDLSVPEVAQALGINVNTAYSRLRAARRELEQAVANHTGETR